MGIQDRVGCRMGEDDRNVDPAGLGVFAGDVRTVEGI